MVGRGGWPLGLAVGALCVLLAGCGDDGAAVAGGSSTTSTAAVAPPSTAGPTPTPAPGSAALAPPSTEGPPPDHWYAVEHRGDRFVLVRGTTEGDEIDDLGSMPDDFGVPDTSIPVSVTDLAVSDDGAEAFVAFCCEPVSGAVFRFSTATAGAPESWDLGQQVALRGTVIVRSDSSGSVRWSLDGFDAVAGVTLPEALAVDVAATGDEGSPVATLSAEGPRSSDGGPEDGEVLLTHHADGSVDRTVGLGTPHCAVLATSEGLITTVGEGRLRVDDRCVSDSFTLVTPEGATAEVQLTSTLRDLEADAAGDHLIGVDDTGTVVRLAPGDQIQALSTGRDLVAVGW